MSRQVKTHLTDEEYDRFETIRSGYGFRSAYALAHACINVCTAILAERERRGDEGVPSVGDEIAVAFAEYARHEVQPSDQSMSGGQYEALTSQEQTAKSQEQTAKSKQPHTNKHHADAYLVRNYGGLRRKYSGTLRRGTSETPQDVLHDTVLGLYRFPVEYVTYEEFRAVANEKLKYNGE